MGIGESGPRSRLSIVACIRMRGQAWRARPMHDSTLFRAQRLDRIEQRGPAGWIAAEDEADERGFGLIGSSMIVINPPYTLRPALDEALPVLTDLLGQYDGAHYLLEQRAA